MRKLGWEKRVVRFGESKLMVAESSQLAWVVVGRIGAGKMKALFRVDGEVEFGGEFKMDKFVEFLIVDEKVHFADGVMAVGLKLEVARA